ncbi:hypothetical protein GCM10009557_15400 [Virgisporangium ochraceum]|uniref:Uncharacterized protein n=1 Tax=Virgisporangium ochraceum TaxID=65505 RepID=A0A8J3ZQ91_9ACTN|nr:hypothetical protein Voc01_028510 [Virgisporangium ochraceum]
MRTNAARHGTGVGIVFLRFRTDPPLVGAKVEWVFTVADIDPQAAKVFHIAAQGFHHKLQLTPAGALHAANDSIGRRVTHCGVCLPSNLPSARLSAMAMKDAQLSTQHRNRIKIGIPRLAGTISHAAHYPELVKSCKEGVRERCSPLHVVSA